MKTKNYTPTETMRLNIEFADNGIILRNPDIEDEVTLALIKEKHKEVGYGYDATQDKHRKRKWFPTPREAFAALIDKVVKFDHFRKSAGLKVCKRGTWDSNPWVWAYTFEVIK